MSFTNLMVHPKCVSVVGTLPVPSSSSVTCAPNWTQLNYKALLAFFRSLPHPLRTADLRIYTQGFSESMQALLVFAHAIQGGSPATLEAYTRAVCCFLNFLRKEFYGVTVAAVDAYRAHLHATGKSKATVRAEIGGIRAFYRRLHGYGLCPVNPTVVVKTPKSAQSEHVGSIVMRSLTFAEVDRRSAIAGLRGIRRRH
jgi:hypothetical protein